MTSRSMKAGLAGVATAVMLAATVGAGVAEAQRGPRGMRGGGFGPDFGFGGPRLEVLATALDLTEAQREQARALAEARRPELRQISERARAAQERVRAAVHAKTVDEAAIRAAVAAASDVRADAAVLRAQMRQEFYNLLTPEQQAKADQLQESLRRKVRDRMQPRRTPPAQPQ